LMTGGMLGFLCVSFSNQATSRSELRFEAVVAAALRPDRAGAAVVATARAAGSSLAPRRRGSAHSETRRPRCSAHPGARRALLLALGIGDEQPERQEWADRDVRMVHEVLLGQRKALHDRACLGHVLGIEQEDGSATIGAREPFANLSFEI